MKCDIYWSVSGDSVIEDADYLTSFYTEYYISALEAFRMCSNLLIGFVFPGCILRLKIVYVDKPLSMGMLPVVSYEDEIVISM